MKIRSVAALLYVLGTVANAQTSVNIIGNSAYSLINQRVSANREAFYVYRDVDSGFNHGFPSGLFGSFGKIQIDPGCIDDPQAANGCSTNTNRLDQSHGTVLRVSFATLTENEFAGVNIEDPESYGVFQTGNGYDLTGATQLVFDVRSPGGAKVQFGIGGCVTNFMNIPASSSYTTISVDINSLMSPQGTSTPCPPALSNVHTLFTIVTNSENAPKAGTVLIDNIHFQPVPTSQKIALSFPQSNETFGVIPLQDAVAGRAPIPADQVLRNVTTIYESATVLLALLARGTPTDLINARVLADTFHYGLHHDSHGDPLPVAADGSTGLHNAYSSGDLALFNNQAPPKAGQAGDIRLSGFTANQLCVSTGFCLVLDGATGGNNAFAILALVEAYRKLNDIRYLNDARIIGRWIVGKLTDSTGTGYGGYYLGYPDEGIPPPKPLLTSKSVENNADIFAAFIALAAVEAKLGNTVAANDWTTRANIAGDFVMAMFNPQTGCFFGGTVPAGTPVGPGIDPTGALRGNDVINIFQFLDSNTFTVLAMAAAPRYRTQIDWRRPVQCVLDNFTQAVIAGGQSYQGFNIVKVPTAGPNGIGWEFTGQAIVAMRLVDRLYDESRFEARAQFYLNQLRLAQTSAPFTDSSGLVASTLQDGDTLTPIEQCLSTPFQCIPERVGLAATTWAIFAELGTNVFVGPSFAPVDFDGDGKSDIGVYQTGTGNWFYLRSTLGFGQHLSFGGANFLPVPGDYDGDGETDEAVYDTTNENWFIAQSTAGFRVHPSFGGPGFIPVPGEYDNDGKMDVAVYQISTGHWFIVGSTLGFMNHLAFGGSGFVPVPGDYDGDGKTDVAVYQTSTGHWFFLGSTDGFMQHLSFGGSGFVPVPGDYDGDGQTDTAVFQTSTGHWFFVGSTDGFMQHLAFGGAEYMPVQGDYDGDGQTDTAVYNTTNGNWFIAQSTAGFRVQPSFGGNGFVPVLPQVTILRALGLL